MQTLTQQGERVVLGVVAPRKRWLPAWGLMLGVAAVLYAPTLSYLFYDWWHNPDYSHGFFVPVVVAYLLWRKRKVLSILQPEPSNLGVVAAFGSQLLFLVAYLGADPFLQRVSLLFLVAGATLYLWGWRALREIAFALVLLLLAIPLPALVFNSVAMPLQLVASSWAERLLGLFGIPVFREGNLLQLDRHMLNVTEACSGIRSLATLVTAGTMVAYFLPARWWVRAFFVLSSLPLALAANALRVAGTGVLEQAWGERWADGFLHLFSGWVVFVFTTLLMLGEWLILQRFLSVRAQRKARQP